jgi:SAM-dependent methyltransferase
VAKAWSFDSEFTQSYTRVRQAFIAEFLDAIRGQVPLQSAVDVGCGIGYFSKFLLDRGLDVIAIDGRDENTKEGRRRYPEVSFLTRNVEDPALPGLGVFDLVLCVGLLYHLENPFQAIRNLHALAGKVLIIESMCAPGTEPSLELLDEYLVENQGLNYVALYPTEACLVKMLYRAGFPSVYGFTELPDDKAFQASPSRKKERTMLVASKNRLDAKGLVLLPEPKRSWDIWAAPESPLKSKLSRIRASLEKLRTQLFPRNHGAPKT